jgi:DtxR family Mn-dependent transcriptional regulator
MERDGLVVVTGDRHLELTDRGLRKARRVMRKHRLAERLLTDVIKLDWEQVHTEACRWEHVMSDDVERRLVTLLDHPHQDPYGNPIPGLSELGEPEREVPYLTGVTSLPGVFEALEAVAAPTADGPLPLVLQRIAEPLQTDVGLLGRLESVGLVPGAEITVTPADGEFAIVVDSSDDRIHLADDVARHLFVTAR